MIIALCKQMSIPYCLIGDGGVELGYGIGHYYAGGNTVNPLPVGIMAKGLLHGFATLYGISIVGCLFIFGMSFLLPDGLLKTAIMMGSLLAFFVLIIICIVLRLRQPDIFSVKEEYHLTITTEGSKIPNGEIVKEITKLDTPKQFPQINNKPKGMGEQ